MTFQFKKKVITSISDNNQSKKVVVNRIYLTNLCKIPTLNYFETPFYIKIDIPMNKYFFPKNSSKRYYFIYCRGLDTKFIAYKLYSRKFRKRQDRLNSNDINSWRFISHTFSVTCINKINPRFALKPLIAYTYKGFLRIYIYGDCSYVCQQCTHLYLLVY